MSQLQHNIARLFTPPPLDCNWDSPAWGGAAAVSVSSFHPQSGSHRPIVRAKLGHTENALHVLFRVSDRFVKALCSNYGGKVCRDSCVEIFLQPKADAGYFNIEINCGGVMLIWYVIDSTPIPGSLKQKVDIPESESRAIAVQHTLPRRVPDEITEPTEWLLQATIPISFFEPYVGPIGGLAGQAWRGNLFKCADGTSQPHWAAWNPIGEALNFHDPAFFGILQFEAQHGAA